MSRSALRTATRTADQRARSRLGAAIVLLAIVPLLGSCRGAGGRPPNVILVVIDTLRFDHLSQYGYPLATSPGFDALAALASRFERAYAPSSWTGPSTASILSANLCRRPGSW